MYYEDIILAAELFFFVAMPLWSVLRPLLLVTPFPLMVLHIDDGGRGSQNFVS